MSQVGKLCWSLVVFAPLCALCANNNWQKSGDTLNGNWNEAGHWSGGVPVAAPPTGEGSYLQRVIFPTGSYTVTFPEGETVSTANLTINTVQGNTKVFSGLGSRFLLAATDADNYQKDGTAQAFRLNFAVTSGNNQGANMTVGDYQAPLALFTNFQAAVSLSDSHAKVLLDGGLYDFTAPTGGVSRTDTKITLGYEGLNGNFSTDADMTTELKGGAVLRVPEVELSGGFAVNSLVLNASTGVVGQAFTMGGVKNGTNRMTQCLTLDDGALLSVGADLGDVTKSAFTTPASGSRATARNQTREILVTGGSTLHSDAKVVINSGLTTLRVEEGSLFSSVGEVHIPSDTSATGTVVVVDSEMRLTRELYMGYSSGVNEMIGRLFATNATISAQHIYGRLRSEMTLAGTTSASVKGNFEIGTLDGGNCTLNVCDEAAIVAPTTFYVAFRGRGRATVAGGSVAAKQVIVAESKDAQGELTISGGEVSATTSVCMGFYSGSSGSLVMTDGILTSPKVYTYNGTGSYRLDGGVINTADFSVTFGSATLSADGGTLHITAAGGSVLQNFASAELGEKGLTIDTAYGLTLAQDFMSKAGVTGLLAFAGESTLTVPAGRTIDAALWMKGGTTLAYGGARLGGLVLGETDRAATVNVTLGSPIAVTGDVDVQKVRLVVTGTCETGATYPLVTCTGDVSAGTAAAWEAAELGASLAPTQYAELAVVDGAAGGKVLQMTVKEMKVVPLALASGEETVSTNITLGMHDQLEVTVGEGAVLTLAGVVTGDSIVKKGTGRLIVGNAENKLATGFYLTDGLLSAPTAVALGDGIGYLSGGTLEVTGETAFANPLVIAPANDAQAVVVKTEADVTMPLPQASVGAFLKRGAGKLTLTVAESTSAFAPMSVGGNRTAAVVPFPESGVVPVAPYYSVHVVEGELVFKGLADGVAVTMPNGFAVGLNTLDGTVAPKLTFDHVAVTASGSLIDNAGYMTKDGSFCRKTFVALRNGAALSVANFYNGRSTKNQGITTEVTVEDSTITATTAYWVNDSDGTNIPLNTFRNSNVYCAAFGVQGCGGTNVFDNCVVAKNANGDGVTLQQQDNKASYFLFRNGTIFRHSTLSCNSDRTNYPNTPYIFAFDGATWDMGAKDVAYTNVTSVSPKKGITLYVHSIGEGVTFNPGEGFVWSLQLQRPIQGDGKILVKGAGTLDLNGETYENAKVGGTGTLRNVALAGTKLTVCADVEAAGALTLGENATCAATKGCVDFGRTEADPVPYKDLSYPLAVLNAGTVAIPDAASWRVANTGVSGLKGSFAADSGVLSLTGLDVAGLMLIFR